MSAGDVICSQSLVIFAFHGFLILLLKHGEFVWCSTKSNLAGVCLLSRSLDVSYHRESHSQELSSVSIEINRTSCVEMI